MNLANLPNIAQMFSFIPNTETEFKCPQCIFNPSQNEINFKNLKFYLFKGFLILTAFGKFASSV